MQAEFTHRFIGCENMSNSIESFSNAIDVIYTKKCTRNAKKFIASAFRFNCFHSALVKGFAYVEFAYVNKSQCGACFGERSDWGRGSGKEATAWQNGRVSMGVSEKRAADKKKRDAKNRKNRLNIWDNCFEMAEYQLITRNSFPLSALHRRFPLSAGIANFRYFA